MRDERDHLVGQVENLTAQITLYRDELARCGDGRLVPRGPKAPPAIDDPRFQPPPFHDKPETSPRVVLVSRDELRKPPTPKARNPKPTTPKIAARTAQVVELLRAHPAGLRGPEIQQRLNLRSANHLAQILIKISGSIEFALDHMPNGKSCKRYRWIEGPCIGKVIGQENGYAIVAVEKTGEGETLCPTTTRR
jgi:hypothetical protein